MYVAPSTVPATVGLTTAGAMPLAQPRAARGLWPAWLKTVLARSAERRQLLALEERDLRDIGLTPSEARTLAQKPLWRG